MRINSITARSFGGLKNRTVQFTDGLNVVVGKNEAGKSTLFFALLNGLLTGTKLGKLKLQSDISKWVPVNGDTCSVSLSFSAGKETFNLSKTWLPKPSSSLELIGGSTFTDDSAVQEMISAKLPASVGTMKSTLMMYQMGLNNTIDDIVGEDSSVTSELGDILRRTLLNTDGVSIDQLRKRADAIVAEYLSHWDIQGKKPEGGRGVENQWKKEVGRVLKAYYELESQKQILRTIKNFETDYDRINSELNASTSEILQLESLFAGNAVIVTSLRERQVLNAQHTAAKLETGEFRKANSEWPVLLSKIEEISQQLPLIQQSIDAKLKEFEKAKEAENNRSKLERYRRIADLKKIVDEKETGLKSAKVMSSKDVEKLSVLKNEQEKILTRISAGALRMQIEANGDSVLTVQNDADEQRQLSVKKGESYSLEAGGRISIRNDALSISVVSGKGDVDGDLKRFQSLKEELTALLKQFTVESVDEAKSLSVQYEKAVTELSYAKKNYLAELGPLEYSEMERELSTSNTASVSRPSNELFAELTVLKNDHANISKELAAKRSQIAAFEKKYQTQDLLMDQLALKLHELKNVDAKLDKLPPIPPAVTDTDDFIRLHGKQEAELLQRRERLQRLREKKAELDGAAPETSSEDLESLVLNLQRDFDNELDTALSWLTVQNEINALSQSVDTNTYDGITAELTRTITALTSGRYSSIVMKDAVPERFVTQDELSLPLEYLSTGTKDIIGLAVRLAMGKYFLGDSEGFIVFDDPFVNLDSGRKSEAANIIRSFAAQNQTIIFTCHQDHAELLGGTIISL